MYIYISRPESPITSSGENLQELRRAAAELPWCAQQCSKQHVPSLAASLPPLVSLYILCTCQIKQMFEMLRALVTATAEINGFPGRTDTFWGFVLGVVFPIGGRNLFLLTVISWGTLSFIDTSVFSFELITPHCIVCHTEMKLGFWCRGMPRIKSTRQGQQLCLNLEEDAAAQNHSAEYENKAAAWFHRNTIWMDGFCVCTSSRLCHQPT